jgi:hypothetical protein
MSSPNMSIGTLHCDSRSPRGERRRCTYAARSKNYLSCRVLIATLDLWPERIVAATAGLPVVL